MFCSTDNRKQRRETGFPFTYVAYGITVLPKHTITFFVYKAQHTGLLALISDKEIETVYILGNHNLQFDSPVPKLK
jgi:hypothetical protein